MMIIAGAYNVAAPIDVGLLSRIFKPPGIELRVELSRRNKPIIKIEIYGAGERYYFTIPMLCMFCGVAGST